MLPSKRCGTNSTLSPTLKRCGAVMVVLPFGLRNGQAGGRPGPQPVPGRAGPGSVELQVAGRKLAVLAALDVEGDALAVVQALQPGALDVGDMDKDIGGPVRGLDEAVALGCVEPLHSAGRHNRNSI